MKKVLEIVTYPGWNSRASSDLDALTYGTSPITSTDVLACLTGLMEHRYSESIELKLVSPPTPLPDTDYVYNVVRGVVISPYYLHQSCNVSPLNVVKNTEWFNWSIPNKPSHMFCILDDEHWKVLWIVRYGRHKSSKIYYLDPVATNNYDACFNTVFSSVEMEKYKERAQAFISIATDHLWSQFGNVALSCVPIYQDSNRNYSGTIVALNIAKVMQDFDPDNIDLLRVTITHPDIIDVRSFLLYDILTPKFDSFRGDEPAFNKVENVDEQAEAEDPANNEDLREFLDPEFRSIFPRLFHIHSAAKLVQDSVVLPMDDQDLKNELMKVNFLDFINDGDKLTQKEKNTIMESQMVTFPAPIFKNYPDIIRRKEENKKMCPLYAKVLHECVDIIEIEKPFKCGPLTEKALKDANCDIKTFLHRRVDKVEEEQKLSYRVQNMMVLRYFKRNKFAGYDDSTGYPIIQKPNNQTYVIVPPLDSMRAADEVLSNWCINTKNSQPPKYRVGGHNFKKLIAGRLLRSRDNGTEINGNSNKRRILFDEEHDEDEDDLFENKHQRIS